MSFHIETRIFCRLAAPIAAFLAVFSLGHTAQAQYLNQQRSVGGVFISTEGVLTRLDAGELKDLHEARAKALAKAPADLNQPTKLRMLSLKKLQQAIVESQRQNQTLPDEMHYLAGLQRVEFVILDLERHDLVLAGPAEGWKLDASGEVVGAITGQPVLHLDDLLVALRTVDAARNGGISCSIDPTNEGVKRLREFMSKQKTIGNADQTLAEIERQLGPQRITVAGVPDTSRFAQVMVSADFRMKRLAMNFEPAPVQGMPSYLELLPSAAKLQNMMPRWWMAANYEPIARDEEGLTWRLQGPGVKCMTEDDFVTATGGREGSGKANAIAQKWADTMTAKYADLSAKDPIFGELRNCMDLAVIATLILRERLDDKAGCPLDTLKDEKLLPLEVYAAPKQVDSKASAIKKGHNWLISASGGVQFQPWAISQSAKTTDALKAMRAKIITAAAGGEEPKTWWWN